MKPRLLFLAPRFPFPLHSGGERWIYSLATRLQSRYDVTLFSFLKHGREVPQTAFAQRMEASCAVRRVLTLPPVVVEAERHPAGFPYSAKSFHSREAVETLRKTIRRVRPSIVQIHFMEMAHFVSEIPRSIPTVLTEHDTSHFQGRGSYLRETAHGNGSESGRLRSYARRFYPRFSAITTLCAEDSRYLGEFLGRPALPITPTTIDVEAFEAGAGPAARGPVFAFVGHYAHYPNEDAAVYFCKEIFPRIRRRVPTAKALMIGSSPTPRIRELASPAITIAGDVPDVRPYLRRSSVFVAPVRLGGGTKGKILEAFASGLPVVATPRVAAGLDAAARGRVLRVGKGAQDFADKAIELLGKSALRTRLIKNGRRFVRRRHDHAVTVKRFIELYKSLINRKK